ncbi:MAG: ATP-binding cassette domain-containing protein [Proteobacteria bacterium]|nr:ATP-binding cassette domain-containing protein [Pseudomonadota bacterium]MBU1685720.1 ATP-binding cassette domain-containing protein [Pseudomonadota bacterium]
MIRFEEISHHYPGQEHELLLDTISLTIERGECVGLTGPSGCGKSTLAHIGAGHIRPTGGRVLIEGRDLTAQPSRKVFLIHQEHDLFPWQRVEKQIQFAMTTPDAGRIKELLRLVRLTGYETFFPNQLSGGMKKRLALARALAVNPDLLILDESFSSLDSQLKTELHEDLRRIWRETGTTILMITHDSRELANLAHREIRLTAERPTRIRKGALV